MKPERKGKMLNTSIGEGGYKRLKEMAEYWDISAAEVIRRALDDLHEKFLKTRYGFKGEALAKHKISKEAKAQKRQEAVDLIRGMNPEELTAHLEELGYFKFYEPAPNVRDVIEASEGSGLPMWVQYRVNPDGSVMSKREVFTLDEVINDLKKNKFI